MEMVIKLGINGMNGHNNYPNLDGFDVNFEFHFFLKQASPADQ